MLSLERRYRRHHEAQKQQQEQQQQEQQQQEQGQGQEGGSSTPAGEAPLGREAGQEVEGFEESEEDRRLREVLQATYPEVGGSVNGGEIAAWSRFGVLAYAYMQYLPV